MADQNESLPPALLRQQALALLNDAIDILDGLDLTTAAARLSLVIDEVNAAELD